MTAADLAARADRVKAIVEAVHGKVIKRTSTTMLIQIPADIAPGMATIWGEGGFSAIYSGQTSAVGGGHHAADTPGLRAKGRAQ
jgi:hypothetical protein